MGHVFLGFSGPARASAEMMQTTPTAQVPVRVVSANATPVKVQAQMGKKIPIPGVVSRPDDARKEDTRRETERKREAGEKGAAEARRQEDKARALALQAQTESAQKKQTAERNAKREQLEKEAEKQGLQERERQARKEDDQRRADAQAAAEQAILDEQDRVKADCDRRGGRIVGGVCQVKQVSIRVNRYPDTDDAYPTRRDAQADTVAPQQDAQADTSAPGEKGSGIVIAAAAGVLIAGLWAWSRNRKGASLSGVRRRSYRRRKR